MIKPLNWKTPLLIAVVFLIMLIKSRYQTSSQDAELSLRQAYSGAVDSWPAPWVDAGIEWQALAEIPALAPGDEHLIALGEQLFFDPLLSESGQIACASCHEPNLLLLTHVRCPLGMSVRRVDAMLLLYYLVAIFRRSSGMEGLLALKHRC